MIRRQDFHETVLESFQEFGGQTDAELKHLEVNVSAANEYAERTRNHFWRNRIEPDVAIAAAFKLGLVIGLRLRERRPRS